MNASDRELAAFQTCMLNALHEHQSAADILAVMRDDDATLPFRDYIAGFEPEMLEVAALLVKKWGVRDQTSQAGNLANMPH